MTVQLKSNMEQFYRLVSLGYNLIKLNVNLTPASSGWTEAGFAFEKEFQENTNYGIVGGSEHVAANGEKGRLVIYDFDTKEKVKDEKTGMSKHIVHEDAVAELEKVMSRLENFPVYLARTKTMGAHMGCITNSKVAQGVNNYQSQNCSNLHIDTRTELGYVVAIAPNYSIEKIPDAFAKPINNFKDFMYALSFESVNEITTSGGSAYSGSLSETFKSKARNMIRKMDIAEFPEFGTGSVGTHDVISFLTMSQRSLKVPEDEAVEKIMELLSRITTSKDNQLTEEGIHKMYRKDYAGFGKDDRGTTVPVEIVESKRLERERKETPIQQIENYLNTRVKDDPHLISQLLRTGLSAYTDNPINIFLLAPSSDGKTYATVKVMENFPKEDVIQIGRMTPTALIHQHGELIDENGESVQEKLSDLEQQIADAKDKDAKENLRKQRQRIMNNSRKCVDLKNKILLFLDNPEPKLFEMLKPIMSHDAREIVYKTTKGDGSLQVAESVIRNWPVFIFCSAKNEEKNEIWEEIKTRVIMTSPNSNVGKYKAANKYTAQKMGLPNWGSSIYHNDEDEKWAKWYILEFRKVLNDLCGDGNPVTNTFHAQLADIFPSNQGEFMRHFPRLLSFINLETLLNAERRPVYEIDNGVNILKTIFSTLDDVDMACKLLGNISSLPPEKLKFYQDVFCPLSDRKLNINNQMSLDGPWLTSAELAQEYVSKFGKIVTSKQILENYLQPLVDAGILQKDDQHKTNLYSKDGKMTIHNILEIKDRIIEQSNVVEIGVISCLESLIRCSTENRKPQEKLTFQDKVIDLEYLFTLLFPSRPNMESQ